MPKSTVPAAPPAGGDVFTMTLAELRRRANTVREHLGAIDQLLPGLVVYTQADRASSSGKFRDGEAEALAPLVDAAVAHPGYFDVLADEDEGEDPDRFEPELVKDRLERRAVIAGLSQPLAALAQRVSDTELDLGDKTRPVLLALHELIKPLAKRKPELRAFAAAAIDYYRNLARKAARSRAEKLAEEAAAGGDAPPK